MSIFCGPTDVFEQICEGKGVATMPNLDKLAEVPYDILSDVHFASAMVGVLKRKPRRVIIAPECTAYLMAQNFNKKLMTVQNTIATRRAEQEKIVRRIRKILTAVWSYGRHAIIENPWASAFWTQEFCIDLKTDLPSNRNGVILSLTCAALVAPVLRLCDFAPPCQRQQQNTCKTLHVIMA